ncbi:sulfite exporter TauE/SafE family protein [Sandaracinobacteroides hominis]|uniref:sulfite exporter TauE/SafE family protein n=1 Tax=Sandaracinobacteroides hominis TaxID=2780086 RepID=UPI001F46A5C0|nr:sulfite exporter TauE/SafE family protein [Sandaracinobacteroides hominis]
MELGPEFFTFVAVGFFAQLVDGALGMAFGVISTSALVALGVPPAAASAGVHAVETVTTAVSGASHAIARNIDWKLFTRIAVPGIIGAVLGAYLLTSIPADKAKPLIQAYLGILGIWIFWRGFRHIHVEREPRIVEPLGLVGGFMDAAGGGGWGPIVTSNLIVQGKAPRQTVGTVNAAEFLVTTSAAITFIYHLGWEVVTTATLGLLAGGVIAAPFGAILARRLKSDVLMVMVGAVLMLTSAFGIWRYFA